MAKWRALGCVPDSEEDDDSQISDQSDFAEQDFHNKDDIERDVEKISATDEPFVPSEGLAGGRKEAEAGNIQKHDEDQAAGVAKPALRECEPVDSTTTSAQQEQSDPLQSQFGVVNIDELQQDHYEPAPVPRPGVQWLLAVEIGSPCPSSPNANRESVSSSPLSELSSSPPTVLALEVAKDVQPSKVTRPAGGRLATTSEQETTFNIHGHQEAREPPSGNAIFERIKASRNLRHRNPIQLHPYAIEGEKYRQILKARGVKPLRISQFQENLESQNEYESQGLGFAAYEDSQPQSNDVGVQDQIAPLSSYDYETPKSPPTYAIDLDPLEDEFPDVSVLLGIHPSHVAVGTSKRRKVTHTYSKERGFLQQRKPRSKYQETPPLALDPIFEVPRSPPRSGPLTPQVSSPGRNGEFRVPPGLSPIKPPTPVTSSEPRIQSPVKYHGNRSPTLWSSAESSDDGNEMVADSRSNASENEAGYHIERVQRKMRGVLPASWLRLDLKTQKKKPEGSVGAHRSISPSKPNAQRGVARNLMPHRSPEKPARAESPIIVSDDETSDPSQHYCARRAFPDRYSLRADENVEHYDGGQFFDTNIGEVIEDNRIDEMLPSRKRLNNHNKKRRKKQIRLQATKSVKPRSAAPNHDGYRLKQAYQPRITDHMAKDPKPRFRPPKLSILDAPKQHGSTNTPRFLKIASRTARSRVDKGRHSPTRKYIRLATSSDTIEPRETLRNWREGTILPVELPLDSISTKVSDRQPLHSGSGNRQPRSNLARKIANVRGNDSRAVNVRLLEGKSGIMKNSKVQSSLDRVVQRPEKRPARDRSEIDRRHNKGGYQIQDFGRKFTTLRKSDDSRPALLESLQADDDRNHPREVFQRHLTNAGRAEDLSGASNILLERFLDIDAKSPTTLTPPNLKHRRLSEKCSINQAQPKISLPSRSRKRPPRRINVDARNFRQISPSTHVDSIIDLRTRLDQEGEGILQGLGPFGTRYTQSFDILPLPIGIFLHSSTFIGSGSLHRSLQLERRVNMDILRGSAKLQLGQDVFKWGPWNDTVSTQLGSVFDFITEHLQPRSHETGRVDQQSTISMLTNVIQYFSEHLSFLDPIDRVSSLQRCKALLSTLLVTIDSQIVPNNESQQDSRLYILTLLLVFTNQLRQISAHELAPQHLKSEVYSLVLGIVQRTLQIALNEGFESLPACLENLKHLEACEHGIREGCRSIEALVAAHHILRESGESLAVFWNIVRISIVDHASHKNFEIRSLEHGWRKLFNILPFLAFDAQGLLEPGQQFTVSNDGWSYVKQLVSIVFELHIANPTSQGATFNAYCRALFGRCLHLVNAWGWYRCESIIGTLFDFLARNDLAHLSNEESHGSPRFLEHLAQKPDLKASVEDRCFHLFLKMVGTGLKYMRAIYSEKKIRDIVWRLMPNHGRLHPKEEVLHQRDLDALRNHHDLISTLYWAAPPAVRPRLGVIRNLVHLESSHREACHINIRAWLNLVQFQLSIDEEVSTLESFAEWHGDILGQLLRQHESARTEAESHVQSTEHNGFIPNHVLEATIAGNQRQVAEVLGDALVSLKIALCAVKNQEQATMLLTPALTPVFGLFNAKKPHANKSIIQALDVLSAYLDRVVSEENHLKNRMSNDDSQDYGDWSAFDDEILLKDSNLPQPDDLGAQHLFDSFYEPIKQLLSNCFGADTVPEDALLLKLVDDWVAMANILVRQGRKSWNDYVSLFGLDSWGFLRHTEQSQKYSNYYMAVLIESDGKIYQEQTTFFLTSWIESLVERESLIKFQYKFTTAILNIGSGDPILRNVPFWTDPQTGRFNVNASEFLDRRLSLISSLLSNMRESLEDAHLEMSSNLSALKQEYQVLVRHLMSAMKRNYQALGHESNVQSTYVEFVQRVIEFLQQYTSEICVIDRFFTDSSAFPLPATDPTYVVGRLKSYGLRLQDSRTPKQLVIFLQSVSERAAVDGQQTYLVSQLYTAMSNVIERGIMGKPTLQSFVVQAIVPAYIEMAFSTFSGWLLASPILQALRDIFRGFLTCLNGTSADSIASVVSIVTAFANSVLKAMALLIDHSGLLEQSHILRLLGLIYSAITALLPTLDYVVRLSETTPQFVRSVEIFKSFAIFSSELLLNHEDAQPPEMDEFSDVVPGTYIELREFALKELRDSLTKNWVYHDGHYYVIRGNSRRDVVCNDIPYSEEKEKLLLEFDNFHHSLRAMPAFCD